MPSSLSRPALRARPPATPAGEGRAASAFGQRVLAVRQRMGLSQRALAARAGLAPSSVSKIENARVSPTYDVMLRIAAALEVDIATLLGAEAPAAGSVAPQAWLVIDRAEGRARHPARVYDYAPVALALKQRIMDPTLIHVRAKSLNEFADWVHHPGEEFVLVLSGRVTLHTEHYAPVELGPGDAACYDAEMGHVFTTDAAGATILNITARRRSEGDG